MRPLVPCAGSRDRQVDAPARSAHRWCRQGVAFRKRPRHLTRSSLPRSAAAFERSDVTAVPAAGVIGESMVALTLARAMREKFGGDSLGEMKRNFEGYREQLRGY